VLFAPEILWVWTRDRSTVENTQQLVRLLTVGAALNGLLHLPYALQVAHGWTRLSIYMNLGAVALLGPLIVFMVMHYGASGAATVWVALNAGYILVSVHVMHRHFLRGEKWVWYLNDVGKPLAAALACGLLGRWLIPSPMPIPLTVAAVATVGLFSTAAAVLGASHIRVWLHAQLTSRWTQNEPGTFHKGVELAPRGSQSKPSSDELGGP
jgi:O-antigen/teichoic acid export membrane protein